MKIKKIIFLVFFVSIIFSLFGVLLVKAYKGSNDIKKVEYVAYYKKGFSRLNNNLKGKIPTCYSFLSQKKVSWNTTASYVVNANNPQGLPEDFIKNSVFNSAETWDNATSREVANDNILLDNSVVYGKRDNKNVIVFGNNYSDPNVIAVTAIWYNVKTGAILEFDISFETDYQWGNAEINPQLMDLQNIATHELGHAFGMGDVYKDECSGVTMHGYADYGETQKRTLEGADIKGLQILYGY